MHCSVPALLLRRLAPVVHRIWCAALTTAALMAGVPYAVAQCPPQWIPGDGFDLRGGAATDVVNALAEMPNGDLVAGGEFAAVGGVAVANIARWNGVVWSPLGSGIQGPVYALAVLSNGDLVAGGAFTNAGGVAVNNIARWDGSTWSDLGGGVTGLQAWPTAVRALRALPGGVLIAGGHFTAAGVVSAANVARWDGFSWSAMGAGFTDPFLPVEVDCFTALPNGDVVAGTHAGGNARVSSWNGTTWSVLLLSQLPGTAVYALTSMPNGDVVAAGNFWTLQTGLNSIARWNGAAWTNLGSGVSSVTSIRALTVLTNGDLVAGGSFTSIGGTAASHLARWDGTQWASFGTVGGDVNSLVRMSSGIMVAGGAFGPTSSVDNHRIARWGCSLGIAQSTPFGRGCYWHASSFYESFDAPQSFDLGSSTLRLTRTATGYDVTHVPGAPAFVNPALSTPALPLTDDSVVPQGLPFTVPYPGGTTNQIMVGSNGYILMQASSDSGPYYLNVPLLLGSAPRHAALWSDFDPAFPGTGAGEVKFESVGSTAVYVTWLGIQEYGVPGAVCTFQIALFANGNVEYRYLGCAHQMPVLTGWSPGNGAQDPTERDLSTFGPFSTTSLPFRLPLQHAADQRPKLGSSVTLTTSGLPASSLLGLTLVGFTSYDPGIELSSIGMPGCSLFTSLDLMFPFFPVAQSGSLTIAIPNQANLLGFLLHTQGTAWDATANAFGMLTSNGITLRVGNP